MKIISAASFAIAAAFSMSGVAFADVSAGSQAAVKAAIASQCKAFQSADYDGFAKTLADDYKETDAAGKSMTKEQSIDSLKKQVATLNLKVTACDSTIKSATGDDTTVTVDILSSTDGTVEQQGQSYPVHVDSRDTEVWTKSGDSWIEKSSTEKGHVVKAAGQVVDQAGTINR